ncbi:quinate 5-dehydrogenase [Natronincola peptidivorans]|nr:quinate 5-dehydrogenase [Natronincola peptidivorans]
MKRIVSVSLGSSNRNHSVEIEVLGEKFLVERIGTDGSIKEAIALIEAQDGKVDALGMGGIDLYLWAGGKRYTIREALPLKRAAKITPILDGSGLKNTLERRVMKELQEKNIVDFNEKVTLLTCVLDRFGMAEAIAQYKGKLIIGDIVFALGLDLPIYSLRHIQLIAKLAAPLVCQLPFEMLYPTGTKQNESKVTKLQKYYQEADIIAGDYHYIKRYMPKEMKEKIIITNTVTKADIIALKEKGVSMLITTTPQFGDRSFGTNLIEALIVAVMKEGKYKSYGEVIDVLDFKPRIEYLQPQSNM